MVRRQWGSASRSASPGRNANGRLRPRRFAPPRDEPTCANGARFGSSRWSGQVSPTPHPENLSSMKVLLERELKFEVDERFTLPRLDDILPDTQVVPTTVELSSA